MKKKFRNLGNDVLEFDTDILYGYMNRTDLINYVRYLTCIRKGLLPKFSYYYNSQVEMLHTTFSVILLLIDLFVVFIFLCFYYIFIFLYLCFVNKENEKDYEEFSDKFYYFFVNKKTKRTKLFGLFFYIINSAFGEAYYNCNDPGFMKYI